MHSTRNIFLVRPSNFAFNRETASSNSFQKESIKLNKKDIPKRVNAEFDGMLKTVENKGIKPLVFEDTSHPPKPDAIFPNNWITTHSDGTVILYPMYAPNRRHERRSSLIEALKKSFEITNILDLSHNEEAGKFLEGTGSIVFDHDNKIAYACLSARTNKDLFIYVAKYLGYKPVYFHAKDQLDNDIYHTNVMMSISSKFAVICLDSIKDPNEKKMVSDLLAQTGHSVIDISYDQLLHFAGNMLSLKNEEGKDILILSTTAFESLEKSQLEELEKNAELCPVDVATIEMIGGGGARCMITEIFLDLI